MTSRRALRHFAGLAAMLPALLLIALLYVLPLARLAELSFGEHSFSLDAYRELFGDWSYSAILFRTLRLSVYVVMGCLLFGYPIAYVIAFASRRRRVVLSLLVLLPYWTS